LGGEKEAWTNCAKRSKDVLLSRRFSKECWEGTLHMVTKIAADPRIDPRIKAMFGTVEQPESPDVPDRETLLARSNSEEAKARTPMIEGFFDQMDNEAVASSNGLTSRWESLVSAPDGNTCRPSGAFSKPGAGSSRRKASQWR
jgi:hypothetical protein